ncbi:hypothetical protein M408DRAFT_10614 [Serendipita vermifera MAFF 305830]|uniref:Uncharacterized protein n=1 Tax=Serendipita vermifera MAFF 305830 TaxID=933852 RepID=A0A0C3B0K9_SERVB|nr:hypothetical protein M408DRAFT_10614 [Serendipita vermifera MAFF 305830]
MAADFATRAIILTEVTEFIDSITTLVTEGEIKIDREDREEAGYLMNSSVYRLDESFSALQTALRLDFGYHTLSFPKGVLSNLRTLHLRMIPEPASKVFAIVLNINGLRELVLDICNNKEDLSIEQINAMVRPLPLELLYLKEVALPFISCFVRPEMISKATNLRIEPCQQTSFQRPTPAGSVWIDLYHSYVLFEHGSGNGVTRVGVDNAYILAHTQTLVDYSHVTSLRWVGGPMKELPFQWLPSLRSLIFEYYPSIGSLQRQTLGDVIGSHLIASCPHLEYLGFTMTSDTHRSDGSEIELATFLQEWLGAHDPEDNPEAELPCFLKSWRDIYGEVFSEVEIYDKYRPGHWTEMLETFQDLTGRFEIKKIPFAGKLSIS